MNLRIQFALVATLLIALAAASSAQPLGAPTPATTVTGVTVLTHPSDATLSFRGGMELSGLTPLDLPNTLAGRFNLKASGPGISRTQGIVFIPGPGGLPYLLSEPPGMSGGLLVRAMSYPGLPDITAGRGARGVFLALAGTGVLFRAVREHLSYRDHLDEFGAYSADRGQDDRRARDSWLIYGAAVWATSALDYMIRPRFELRETTPARVSLGVTPVTRQGALWRSSLVPGAGQDYSNHRARGAFWLSAALAAGAGMVIASNTVEQNQTKVDWAAVSVDSAGPSERPLRARELEVFRNHLQGSEDARRGFGIALTAIWIANLIDTAVMPLAPPAPTKPKIQASIPISSTGVAVALQYKF